MFKNLLGFSAGVFYVVSGLVGGSDGQIGPLYKVDILHYGLVVGNILFMYALQTVVNTDKQN
jgi:hypothetical protein